MCLKQNSGYPRIYFLVGQRRQIRARRMLTAAYLLFSTASNGLHTFTSVVLTPEVLKESSCIKLGRHRPVETKKFTSKKRNKKVEKISALQHPLLSFPQRRVSDGLLRRSVPSISTAISQSATLCLPILPGPEVQAFPAAEPAYPATPSAHLNRRRSARS